MSRVATTTSAGRASPLGSFPAKDASAAFASPPPLTSASGGGIAIASSPTAAATWRPGGPGLRAWLFRVATNLCIDRHRARARAPLGAEALEEVADTSGPPLEGSIAITRAVRAALTALPERQRAALVLVHYHGMTGREAGEALGVGEEAVESLLARGRRQLRQTLSADARDLLETSP